MFSGGTEAGHGLSNKLLVKTDMRSIQKLQEESVKLSKFQESEKIAQGEEKKYHDVVPANTFKIGKLKVKPDIVDKNHAGKHSKLPLMNKTNAINGPHKLEKTHYFTNKINHKMTDPDQNSHFIPFSRNKPRLVGNKAPLVPVYNYQSSHPATPQSFLYNIISPTFGHLIPYPLSSLGPFLQTHTLLHNHRLRFPLFWR